MDDVLGRYLAEKVIIIARTGARMGSCLMDAVVSGGVLNFMQIVASRVIETSREEAPNWRLKGTTNHWPVRCHLWSEPALDGALALR